MTNHQLKIDAAIESIKDEIISFILALVLSPTLANDEGPVENIIID